MKVLALAASLLMVLPALATPVTKAISPANPPGIEGVHDFSLEVAHQEQNHVRFEYSYEPDRKSSKQAERSDDGAVLVPRAQVNWPGVGERVTVALEIAKITIIRIAANNLKVVIDNLTQEGINVLVEWALGDIMDQVPAGATASVSQNVHQGTSQFLDVTAYRQ
ncbi:hypothetical protein Forpe1208_v016776 [Fusarium oxysporum f. sp. rapae]|uniref:Uncharacterized protein n=1 Tax=Fusarium oxysporum f. sp. rapae TaxID=485398 RepID=A0A8J5NGF6_FUSOX|nr:hypothetical protein Forpe1208_v016776 [Fusarium oxysporum f. sp. rapae]